MSLETPAGRMEIRLRAEQTGGSMSVMECWIPPGAGPVLHTHRREDELWCVVDGKFRFRAGDETVEIAAGELAFGPRGTPHTFKNIGTAPGKLLVVCTPGGLERMFEEYARQTVRDTDALAVAGLLCGVEFVGPPL